LRTKGGRQTVASIALRSRSRSMAYRQAPLRLIRADDVIQ
jgi:hypothetical protein